MCTTIIKSANLSKTNFIFCYLELKIIVCSPWVMNWNSGFSIVGRLDSYKKKYICIERDISHALQKEFFTFLTEAFALPVLKYKKLMKQDFNNFNASF